MSFPRLLPLLLAAVALPGTVAAATAAGLSGGSGKKPQARRAERVEFNRDIRPILSDNCFACHGPDAGKRMAGLRLDTEQGAKAQREGRRPAVAPGNPAGSELIARITSAPAALRMPPAHTGKELSPEEVALLKRWIAQGAPYQAHWSYLPPRRPPLPKVRNEGWVVNEIDRFVLARLEAAGLQPSPDADRTTLLRRVTFDLTGLPPTPAEIDAFLADRSPDAYEKVVDRLLASPRYGERMAVFWLDLVRYADTVGYHGDQEHHISPYRDWVIQAFLDNMPFDRFTREQLAGDLLPNATEGQRIATGYNRLLQTTHEGGAQDKEYLAKYAADRVRNLSVVWMGATVGCAECHDHKYDPYTQKDFYSLAAFFADVQEKGAYPGPDQTPTVRAPELEVLSPFDRAEAERLETKLARLRQRLAAAAQAGESGEAVRAELEALQARHAEVLKRKRKTMITVSVPPRTMRVLRRGDWMDEGGEIVQPAVPAFMSGPVGREERLTRLDLARWLTSPEHPQTARVFVNRVWALLFGAGLSRSLEDTGSQGEPPTHPELLDFLAVTFATGDYDGLDGETERRSDRGTGGVRAAASRGADSAIRAQLSPSLRPSVPLSHPWNIKALIKKVVLSRAYRQSSVVSPLLRERDPENRLLARQGRFRLPAEMVRDTALAVSGLLVERLGGPSARPYQPEGYYSLLNFPRRTYTADQDDSQWRRGVYMHWQRQYLHPMLRAFDAPSREECTAQRPVTNTPLAALTLLNDPTFVEAARVFAARILRAGGAGDEARIRWAWRQAVSRMPNEREVGALRKLLAANRAIYAADPAAAKELLATGLAPPPAGLEPAEVAAWTAVARALLNLSETISRN
ncbi:MAG: PSD1 and planctomycete cytochrome C domain-containing protein [Armatimonadota bacterium]